MGLLKLLRSLEGGTKVQQIIIGYFVAPISVLLIYPVLRTKSYTSNNYKILKRLVIQYTNNRERLVSNLISATQLFFGSFTGFGSDQFSV